METDENDIDHDFDIEENVTVFSSLPDDSRQMMPLYELDPGVCMCVALTKFVQMHSRNETWVQDDNRVKDQFERIMEMEF